MMKAVAEVERDSGLGSTRARRAWASVAATAWFALFCVPGPAASPAAARSLEVEDTLNLETVTDAEPSPDGGYILFIKQLASVARKDFAQDIIFGPKTGQLLAVDLRKGGPPRPLLGIPGQEYALGPFSPSSRRVLLYVIAGRKLTLAFYDFATGQLTRLPETPKYAARTDFQPRWVSDDQVIYQTESAGAQPFDLFNRPETQRRLSDVWERSWQGRAPGVIISESRVDGGGNIPELGKLVRFDVKTGETRKLADGVYSDLRLSPDKRYLAALRLYTSGQPPVSLNVDWTFDRRMHAVVFDLSSGSTVLDDRALTAGQGSLEWGPGDRLSLFAWSPDKTSSEGLYYIYDAATGQVFPRAHIGLDLVSERERGWFPRPERGAWLGGGLAVPARPLSKGARPTFTQRDMARFGPAPGVGWYWLGEDGEIRPLTGGMSKVSPVLVSTAGGRLWVIADGQLWRISADGRRAPFFRHRYDSLALAFPPTVRVGSEKEPVVLIASEKGETAYLIPDLSGVTPTRRIDVSPGDEMLAAAPSGSGLFANDRHLSTDIFLRRGSLKLPLLRLNEQLAGVDLGERRQLAFKGAGGEDLTGCLMLPPGYADGRRYPMIVDIYPGITGKCAPAAVNFVSDDELLAAHGYVVLRPGNPPETIRTPDGPIAGMAGVVTNAIDAAIAGGIADPDRIGLWGESQGGWSSLWLSTRMARFKAVVSAQGWADLPSHYLGADHQQLLFPENMPYAMNTPRYDPPAGSEQSIGRTLWEAPEIYVRNSSTMYVDKVTAPTMLISSDMDIFPLWQYQEMYTGLYRLRKPACLVTYMGEGHWPQSPANVRDLWKRMFAWFDFYLRDGSNNGCSNSASDPVISGGPTAKRTSAAARD